MDPIHSINPAASPQPTFDRADAINKTLHPLYKEAVSKIEDPEKREVRGRITSISFEGFDTGILRLEGSRQPMLRQIPANMLNACLEAKDSVELQSQIKKIADYLASFPSHICVSQYEDDVTIKMMTKAWMTANPFMREFATRYQVLQLLCDKANYPCALITIADGLEAQNQFNGMISKFNDLIKPIRYVLQTARTEGDKTVFEFEPLLLKFIKHKIKEDNDFRGILDIYAESTGAFGRAFKEKMYEGIDRP
ncbi:MAG: hypothetical protein LLG04_15520 [Parachlamydia sp.]|nr:hypothetical protein [Parachlamydia sp.]